MRTVTWRRPPQVRCGATQGVCLLGVPSTRRPATVRERSPNPLRSARAESHPLCAPLPGPPPSHPAAAFRPARTQYMRQARRAHFWAGRGGPLLPACSAGQLRDQAHAGEGGAACLRGRQRALGADHCLLRCRVARPCLRWRFRRQRARRLRVGGFEGVDLGIDDRQLLLQVLKLSQHLRILLAQLLLTVGAAREHTREAGEGWWSRSSEKRQGNGLLVGPTAFRRFREPCAGQSSIL